MRVSESITDEVGGTPLIRVESLGQVDVLGKAEWFNPGGSVKDRPALNMVLEGERSGELTEEKTLIDIGTGGTITGVGKRLKEHDPGIEVIGVEPDDPLHGIEGLKHIETSIKPSVLDQSVIDEVIYVSTEEAYDRGRQLAKENGLLVGQSSGAAVSACEQIAEDLDEGTVVTVFPDGGVKYLSTRYLENED